MTHAATTNHAAPSRLAKQVARRLLDYFGCGGKRTVLDAGATLSVPLGQRPPPKRS